MIKRVRLSEISGEAARALTALDRAVLEQIAARLDRTAEDRLEVEPEHVETVAAAQAVLYGVLTATRQNIDVLERLRERKVRAKWAL